MRLPKIDPGKFFSTPTSMHREVEAARKKTKDHLSVFRDQIARYHGRFFSLAKGGQANEWLENHYHDWLSYIVPKVGFSNPRARVKTILPAQQGARAKAGQHALNRWIKMRDIRNVLSAGPLVDMQFNFGVLRVSQEPIPNAPPVAGLDPDGDPEDKDTPYAPSEERVQQELFFEDPLATDRQRIRYQGHVTYADRSDILSRAHKNPDEEWNIPLLTSLSSADASARLERENNEGDIEREEISYIEVYVPEFELDSYPNGDPKPPGGWRKHGFNGTIFTLPDVGTGEENTEDGAGSNGNQWLRAPRPFYGHARGPYVVFGAYVVPNETKFLSPFVVSEPQIRDLNKHVAVQSESAARYSRILIVNKTNPRILEIIKSGEHDGVAAIPGFEKNNVVSVEKGGITEQMLAYTQLAKDRLNRNAHMDDTRQGQAESNVTATATSVAAQASDTRLAWIEERFVRGVTDFLERVLFLLMIDNRVAFPLGSEAAEDLGMDPTVVPLDEGDVPPELEPFVTEVDEGLVAVVPPEPWYRGGLDDSEAAFGLELEVEPYSMERQDDGQLRENTLAAMQLTFSVLSYVQVFGEAVDWKLVLNDIGESFNIPDWAERVDVDTLLQTVTPDPTQPVLVGKNGEGAMPVTPIRTGMEGARQGVTSPGGNGQGRMGGMAGMPGAGLGGPQGGAPSPQTMSIG